MRRIARTGSVGVLVGMLLAVLTGCANQDGEQQAAGVAARFLDAAGRGDTATACALLTPRVREDQAVAEGQSCARSLPVDRLRGGAVTGTDVWSEWARVSTDGGAVFLTEFDSGWLVTAAGCQPNGDAPYRCVVGG
ncbi:MAG: hypothetical protein ACJ72N_06250 [Labedaea sp.]